MSKYIDAEALRAAVIAYHDSLKPQTISRLKDVISDVLDIIDEAPAADVTQVVRCKDCYMHDKCYTEEVFDFAGMTDGFCCVGKRRDDYENAGRD